MAEKDRGDGPSLELPSFGRRRRQPEERETAAAPTPTEGDVDTHAQPGPDPEPAPFFESAAAPEPREPRRAAPSRPRRRRLQRPNLPPALTLPAAMLCGAAVGLLLVLLTWLAMQSCGVVRGTSSCQGAGWFVWIGILAAAVVTGRFLLAWFSLRDPGSTSFLAIGLISVVALLFFSSALGSTWMVLLLPVLGAVSYGLSQWVTTAFVEPTGREAHR